MHYNSAVILAAGLAAQRVVATGWQLDASRYSNPANTDNQCSTPQSSGYNWSSLNTGAFDSYGSNKFSGFTCGDSPNKRDVLSKRTFQSKCISGQLNQKPSISCEDQSQMSIDTYQISSNYDTDVECHYGMPDGSTCKTTHRCQSGGNIIKNDQCGGATNVTFHPKGGDSGEKNGESCSIGIHSIGFNCETASSTVPAYSTATITTTSATSAEVTTTSVSETSILSSTITVATTSASSTEVTASTETSPVTTRAETTPVTSSTPTLTIPAYSTYANSSTTETTSTESSVSPGTTSTFSSTEGIVVSTYGTSTPTSSIASPVTNSSSSVIPATPTSTPSCPDLLPKCLNTWIWQTGCTDNSDYTCYCKDSGFISNVMGCIESWSGADSETQAAASYLQGICAPYVPENPAIITACPSSVTPTGLPASTYPPPSSEASPVTTSAAVETSNAAETTSSAAPPAYAPGTSSTEVSPITATTPMAPTDTCTTSTTPTASAATDTTSTTTLITTLTYSSTITIPCTYTTGESLGFTIPSSSTTTLLQTTITVPQLQFITSTITVPGTTATISVGLAAGSPSAAPAYTTMVATTTAGATAAPVQGTTTSTAVVVSYPTSGFGTSVAAGMQPSASSSPIVPYTGGAQGVRTGVIGGAVAAVAALLLC
ncbi:hypothetical protein B0A48_12986 [Cryoendolithus antarcticus]|uniref:CFEM domain-containing protein n=1 Tax=Cryoendolithus antarcticus TaxID=1507870 RepID=A0A1V8SR06_9PEZI|nr:hypothetical protein B0A48_12986 [Cryoendolithus antarcticus]